MSCRWPSRRALHPPIDHRPGSRAPCLARAAVLGMLIALLAACAGGPRRSGPDGPPASTHDVDLSRIPDAVVRAERPCLPCQRPYRVGAQRYEPLTDVRGFTQRGMASWYGRKFHGRPTATGEPYDMYAMTAAHPVWPLPGYAEVVNLGNGRRVVVRMNDRGPFRRDRVIDLSYAAAARLDMLGPGSALVEVRAIDMPGRNMTAPGAPRVGAGPSPEPETRPVPGGRYLQAGAFGGADRAHALAGQLRAAGLAPVQVRFGDGVHRVRVGPLGPAQADAAQARLAALGIDAYRVRD